MNGARELLMLNVCFRRRAVAIAYEQRQTDDQDLPRGSGQGREHRDGTRVVSFSVGSRTLWTPATRSDWSASKKRRGRKSGEMMPDEDCLSPWVLGTVAESGYYSRSARHSPNRVLSLAAHGSRCPVHGDALSATRTTEFIQEFLYVNGTCGISPRAIRFRR